MKWYILLSVLSVHGATVCMNRPSQVQSNQQERGIDFRLLKLYLNTVDTKRTLASIFVGMPGRVSELSDEQLLLKKNLMKDYTRVNNIQAVILKNIKSSGLDVDKGIEPDSSYINNLIKSKYSDDAVYQTSLARSRQ